MMPLFQFKTVFLTSVTTLFVLGLFVQSYLVQEQNFGTFLKLERGTPAPQEDTKYLLVINKGGLNNQRRSIADAVVWASYLRRTLVLGHLMAKTGEQYDMENVTKVSDIFDTSYINRFVPTIEVEDFIKQNKAAIESKALNMTVMRVPIFSHSSDISEYRHVVLDRLGLREVNEAITLPDGKYDLNDESDFARAIPLLSDAPLLVLETFSSVYRDSMTEHFPITKPNDYIQRLARDYVKKTGLINKQFISMHVRRTDFEDYCADKPVRSSAINKHRIKTIVNPAFPTCWASWEQMAQGTAKLLINNTAFATSEKERNEFNIFLMTDADDLERAVFKQHLESILKKDFQDAKVNLFQFVPSDPSFSMETTGVVVESEIATFANDFIGNRYSSVSASTSSRWLELGKHYSHLYFW